MIRHIQGTVAVITQGQLVVDVAGIGHLIYISLPPEHFKLDASIKLHTHLAVRETALDLYGFLTRDELELFTILLSLPKIGPKSAMQIMQKADIELLQTSVLAEDPAQLSKMSGIGKKTAEKIVVGLKDKFENFTGGYVNVSNSGAPIPPYTVDAIDALIALGYPQADARKTIQQLPDTITNANDAVKEALRELGKG